MEPILDALWPAYRVPILAVGAAWGVGLAVFGAGRALHRPVPAAAAGIAAGWLLLAWPGFPARPPWAAVLNPRQLTDFLLAPALAVAAYGFWRPRGIWVRWGPVLLGFGLSWWVARMPTAAREFWRAWAAAGLVLWLLHRGMAGRVERRGTPAAAAALSGGLWVAGAPAPWSIAALVILAVGMAPPMLIGVMGMAAVLAAGRLVRGGLDPVDVAGLAAAATPFLVPRLTARRWGRAGPGVAALASVGIACCITATAVRLLR